MTKICFFLLIALSKIGVINLRVYIVVSLNGKYAFEMTVSVEQLQNLLNDGIKYFN